jgi:hypothetical protein
MQARAAPRLIPPKALSCMCTFAGSCEFNMGIRRGWFVRNLQCYVTSGNRQLTKQYYNCYTAHELSLPMAPVRTALRKDQTPNDIEYGEAILVALKLKAERQLEVIAPGQQENLLVLCRLMLDIQAVQEKLSRERLRLSVCR